MDSNTHSAGQPAGLAALTAAVEELAAQDLDGLTDAVRAERVRWGRWRRRGVGGWPVTAP